MIQFDVTSVRNSMNICRKKNETVPRRALPLKESKENKHENLYRK